MPEWSTSRRIRDDDPYHCWAYRVAEAQGKSDDGLCPVVIYVRAADETYEGLLSNLLSLRDDLRGSDSAFLISAFDREHLKASIAYAQSRGNDPIEEDRDYLRMLLLYAREKTIFRDDPDFRFDTRNRFDFLFIGRSIRNAMTDTDAGIIMPIRFEKPDAALTIIDDSLAFLNSAFVQTSGAKNSRVKLSRFTEIWFQDREHSQNGQVETGPRLHYEVIDNLLAQTETHSEAELYQTEIPSVGGDPFRPVDMTAQTHQPLAFGQSHGTFVAATALNSFDSFAPEKTLELFGITIPTDVTEDTSGSSLGSYLIAAVRQAMLWNDAFHVDGDQFEAGPASVPLVINFSYGFAAGPKDGSSTLNRVIARMLKSRNAIGRPTALVVPMGNSYLERGVASLTLAPEQKETLFWVVPPDDGTPSFLEINIRPEKASSGSDCRITITPPSADIEPITIVLSDEDPDQSHVLFDGKKPLAELGVWKTNYGSVWQYRVVLALAPTHTLEEGIGVVPEGRWKVELQNPLPGNAEILAIVQRDDVPGTYPAKGRQSYLDAPDAWQYGELETLPEGPRPEHKRPFTGNHDQLDPDGPITHERTASVLASISSQYVHVVGAGMGGDDRSNIPVRPSPYASIGPLGIGRDGPDYMALADASVYLGGIPGTGTLSDSPARMNGSSVSAPQVAGWLAANPQCIKRGDCDLTQIALPPFKRHRHDGGE